VLELSCAAEAAAVDADRVAAAKALACVREGSSGAARAVFNSLEAPMPASGVSHGTPQQLDSDPTPSSGSAAAILLWESVGPRADRPCPNAHLLAACPCDTGCTKAPQSLEQRRSPHGCDLPAPSCFEICPAQRQENGAVPGRIECLGWSGAAWEA
jgi:hypothetical protein